MKRCLHITIHEGSKAAPRRAAASYSTQAEIDPGGPNNVMPPLEDPGGPNNVMPPLEDPDGGSHPYLPGGSGGGSGAGVTVSSCSCDCCCAGPKGASAPGQAATAHPYVRPRDYSGFVIVRLAEGVVADNPADNLWTLATTHQPAELAGLRSVLELPIAAEKAEPAASAARLSGSPEPPPGVLVSRPLVELQGLSGGTGYTAPVPVPLPRTECLNLIRGLEKKAATTAFPPLHSLTAYWRLDLRRHPDLVEKAVESLNRLAEVDLAYRELAAADPQAVSTVAGQHFAEDQGYLDDAPAGISAAWAWKRLAEVAKPKIQASQLTVCDLEQGWITDHLDLAPLVLSAPLYGANRAPDEGSSGYHGTAVLGQLAAAGRIKGAAANLGQFLLASHYKGKDEKEADGDPHPFAGENGNVAAAIVQAIGPLGEGHILLLEVQRGLLPTEIDEADFDAIRLASAHGIIVVEAAGNGGFDLDAYTDPDTRRSLRRADPGFRDSGAIVVGAARASVPHDRAPFSNYGSRLDCFGWGETVTTCGYGDLAGTVATDFYTNAFSGTSSASPIIAGAAALVQALHKAEAGYWLSPLAMRVLLSDPATGTRQGPNVPGFIGVMPDLRAIVRGRLQLVPDVYMRRHIEDDGAALAPDEEISGSPDILLWKGQEPADPRFGEGPRANTPAPGTLLDPGDPNGIYPNQLHVRLRNRGVGAMDNVKVQLFASPAATLITPEYWLPIGPVDVQNIPQGDTLVVSPSLAVNLPQAWPQKAADWPPSGIVPAYSFLAVQLPPDWPPKDYAPGFERTVLLPPGPPYFDWAELRSFLRGRGVTWRNVHPVKAAADMTLAFLLAGTPDRTRHFDFEVIQRLPAGTQVTLEVPQGLAAKLRQRQPWLANGSGKLTLPHRPRTTLKQVALAPGLRPHAAFRVQAGTNALKRGHSLAIRQLWRGEEVGRITWWFVDE